jgi:probable rRNA maturation factor
MSSVADEIRVEVRLDEGAPAEVTAPGLRALARFTLAREGAAGPLAVSLIVTDDATIRTLHAQHLGIDAPTDVLTFALGDDDDFVSGEAAPLLGEVVVSHQTAAAQAADYGQPAAREVRFLIVHGLLHLLGYDDAAADQRAAMLARQEAILAEFDHLAAR